MADGLVDLGSREAGTEGKKEAAATSEALAAHQSFEAIVGGEGSDDDSLYVPLVGFPRQVDTENNTMEAEGIPEAHDKLVPFS